MKIGFCLNRWRFIVSHVIKIKYFRYSSNHIYLVHMKYFIYKWEKLFKRDFALVVNFTPHTMHNEIQWHLHIRWNELDLINLSHHTLLKTTFIDLVLIIFISILYFFFFNNCKIFKILKKKEKQTFNHWLYFFTQFDQFYFSIVQSNTNLHQVKKA